MSKMGKIVVAVVAVVVVLGGGLWYFVLRDTSPPTANLDAIDVPTTTGNPTGTGGSTGAAGSPSASADGTWVVVQGDDVFVGYRVEELFGGQTIKKTAAGRTPAVTGTVAIDGSTIESATFTADVTQLKSDDARRDGAIGTRGLQTETFPEATFTLTEPSTRASPPKEGEEVAVSATGDLTLHGVTKPVTLELTAKWTGSAITVAGTAPIAFADFGMEAINIANVVTTDDHGTLELQLVLQPA
jgi:polyisoprenoid-binding protein YceI